MNREEKFSALRARLIDKTYREPLPESTLVAQAPGLCWLSFDPLPVKARPVLLEVWAVRTVRDIVRQEMYLPFDEHAEH